MKSEVFNTLSRQLEERSPIDIDGTPFTMWLIDIHEHEPPRPDAVQVLIGARHSNESHTGELNINRKRLTEPDFPDLCAETMRRIVTNDLPPGARELL